MRHYAMMMTMSSVVVALNVLFLWTCAAVTAAVPLASTSSPVRRLRPPPVNHHVNLPTRRPLVIAHRGSSGTLPEHTVLAYRRAVDDGADVIECDVTLSRDLVPVCLHENWLETTTDVAKRAEYQERRRNRTIVDSYGYQFWHDGWYAVDFTIAELKTLRKRQSMPFRDQSFNDLLDIATLDEFIWVARTASRPVGIYPELKEPDWINSLAIISASSRRFEDIVLDLLTRHGYSHRRDPCFIQSFSKASLTYLSTRTQLPLVLLIMDTPTDSMLEFWARTLYGLGAWINTVAQHFTVEKEYKNWIGNNTTDLISRAHSHHLMVHVWTVRNEDQFLAWDFQQDVNNAIDLYVELGADGLFTDFPLTVTRHFDDIYGDLDCLSSSQNSAAAADHGRSTIFPALTSLILSIYSLSIFQI